MQKSHKFAGLGLCFLAVVIATPIVAKVNLTNDNLTTKHALVSSKHSLEKVLTSKRNTHDSHDDNNQNIDIYNKHEVNEMANNHSEHDDSVSINLSPEKMTLANIKVDTISAKIQYSTVYAPGEIKANGYKSYIVSPRTDSIIVKRHAVLGEHVEKGQALITLFSESMAQAQADFLLASTEWKRVKTLGKQTLSESRLVQAETTYSAAYGKLIAFGLTKSAINDISTMPTTSFGQYTLMAQSVGVVLKDDFYQGQRVEAGDLVMLIADEQDLWVEAKVAPNKKLNVAINSPAIVKFGSEDYQAKVIQEAHTIDPVTRTRIIRLSVNNQEDTLHPGMFVKIYFQFKTTAEVMAVPENALMRNADGDWIVFVEDHPGEFESVEVILGRTLGNFREITGLKNGSRVVTQGAFFVASEIAKGGFDPHNH